MKYFVYLLECRDGTYYCGWTKNLEKRVLKHNEGNGAKYTRSRRPVRIIYSEMKRTLRKAMQRETEIKLLTRNAKKKLVASASCNQRKAAETQYFYKSTM